MTTAVTGARIVASAVLLAVPVAGHAAVTLTGTTYSTDFNNLTTSTTPVAAPGGVVANGWQFLETDDNANTSYRGGTGSDTDGDTYSFGATGNADRAFGSIGSGTLRPAIGVVFTNSTGGTINALNLSLFGEQWRNGSNTADSLVFEYLVGGTSLAGTAGWVRLSALDILSTVSSPNGAVNGNTARTSYAAAITNLVIASNGTIALRWSDFDAANAEDGLAIDDFALTATLAGVAPVPEPATWAMMIGGFALVGGALRRRTKGVVPA